MSRKLRSSDRRLWGILTQLFYEHFLGIEFFNIHGSRVENRRSGFSLPVATDEAFASSPQSVWHSSVSCCRVGPGNFAPSLPQIRT